MYLNFTFPEQESLGSSKNVLPLKLFCLSTGWLPQSIPEWKFGLEYLATFQFNTNDEKVEKDICSTSCELDINSENSIDGKETRKTNEFLSSDSHDKDQSVVDVGQEKIDFCEENELKTNEKVEITVKSEKESVFETNLEHDKECEEQFSNVIGFDENDKSEQSKIKAPAVKENLNNFEQHTCLKSTLSAGHRSLHIDLKSYVLIMLQKLGAQQTLKTISDTNLQKIFFTQEVYYKCILSSQLENHQRLVTGYFLCKEIYRKLSMFEQAFANYIQVG